MIDKNKVKDLVDKVLNLVDKLELEARFVHRNAVLVDKRIK